MNIVNYTSKQGADFAINLAFKDSDGDALSIVGWTILFTMKQNRALSDNDEGVIKVAGVITDGAGGLAVVTLLADDTKDYTGAYYYDVKYVDDQGNSDTPQEGVIVFSKAVTKRTS